MIKMCSRAFLIFTIISMLMVLSLDRACGHLEAARDGVLESKLMIEKRGLRTKRSSSGNPETFTVAEEIAGLQSHNSYRSQEGASNMEYMEWHPELARMAQDYTEECLYEHSSMVNNGCYNVTYDAVGENLHFNTAKVPLASAVKAWFDEKPDYDFTSGNCPDNKVCGHYTQVVWAKSKLIGCGRAFCAELRENNGNVEKNAYFTSCNYGLRGNYGKNKPYKKGDPCSECPVDKKTCKDQMCYKSGVDYQRPAKKLKDCSHKEAIETSTGYHEDLTTIVDIGTGNNKDETNSGKSTTGEGEDGGGDGGGGDDDDEEGNGDGDDGNTDEGDGGDGDSSDGDGGGGDGDGGGASNDTVNHGYVFVSLLMILFFK